MSVCQNCGGNLPTTTGTRERRWCSDRCRKAAARRRPISSNGHLPDLPPDATISDALEALLGEVRYPPSDPRSVIATVAAKLAAALDRAPSPGLARELRAHLDSLVAHPNEDPDFIDELRAKRAARRVAGLLQWAESGGDES